LIQSVTVNNRRARRKPVGKVIRDFAPSGIVEARERKMPSVSRAQPTTKPEATSSIIRFIRGTTIGCQRLVSMLSLRRNKPSGWINLERSMLRVKTAGEVGGLSRSQNSAENTAEIQ
jgi:hypothetical protein